MQHIFSYEIKNNYDFAVDKPDDEAFVRVFRTFRSFKACKARRRGGEKGRNFRRTINSAVP